MLDNLDNLKTERTAQLILVSKLNMVLGVRGHQLMQV
jgi:hypothetical protein